MTKSQTKVIGCIEEAKDAEEVIKILKNCIEFVKQNGADEAKANEWLKEKYGVELIPEREEEEA